MARVQSQPLRLAIALIALYVGTGGMAKLAGVPYFHSSFPQMGLPAWFGYFIGACEVLGPLGLLVRPLRALAALGVGAIMVGASYYHAVYTPIVQAVPAVVLAVLCGYVFLKSRDDMPRVRPPEERAHEPPVLPR